MSKKSKAKKTSEVPNLEIEDAQATSFNYEFPDQIGIAVNAVSEVVSSETYGNFFLFLADNKSTRSVWLMYHEDLLAPLREPADGDVPAIDYAIELIRMDNKHFVSGNRHVTISCDTGLYNGVDCSEIVTEGSYEMYRMNQSMFNGDNRSIITIQEFKIALAGMLDSIGVRQFMMMCLTKTAGDVTKLGLELGED